MSNDLTTGFANQGSDAQACFRAVLDAMARPGHVHVVRGVAGPPPLSDAAAAVLLTLADHETPLWLDPHAASAQAWIAFHTGAPMVGTGQAMFAMALTLPDLTSLPSGTDDKPENSATLILQVTSLTDGRPFVLDGPGLRHPLGLACDGLPLDFALIWQRNHALYPRGIDLILCAGDRLTALPRGVSIREG